MIRVEALDEAPARFGKPKTFIADQDSQFTSMPLTSVLLREKFAISMDGWDAGAITTLLSACSVH